MWGRVFLDGAGDDICNEERGKRWFTSGHLTSGADSSVISVGVVHTVCPCL